RSDSPQFAAQVKRPAGGGRLYGLVSEAVVQAVLSTCDRPAFGLQARALLLTLFDSGLRTSELLALNLGDSDLADGGLHARRAKSNPGRTVFIDREARRTPARVRGG